jgi:hypothetical protein
VESRNPLFAVSQLYVGKELKDAISTSFGIREIKYEPNKVLVLMEGNQV